MKNVVSYLANVPMMSFLRLREIHRASEYALQGLLRPIDPRGEAKLVSPRGFQKANTLVISNMANLSSRGEFHEGTLQSESILIDKPPLKQILISYYATEHCR